MNRIRGGRCWAPDRTGKLVWVGNAPPAPPPTARFVRGQRVRLWRAVTVHGQHVEPGSLVAVLVPDVDGTGLVTVDCCAALAPVGGRPLSTPVPATVDVGDVTALEDGAEAPPDA